MRKKTSLLKLLFGSPSRPTTKRTQSNSESKVICNSFTDYFEWEQFRVILESAELIYISKDFSTVYSRTKVLLNSLNNLTYQSHILLKSLNVDIERVRNQYQALCNYLAEFDSKWKEGFKRLQKTRDNITCPYCGYQFEKEPSRKRKCPKCKETIIRHVDSYLSGNVYKKRIYLITGQESENLEKIIDIPLKNKEPQLDFCEKLNHNKFIETETSRINGYKRAKIKKYKIIYFDDENDFTLYPKCKEFANKAFSTSQSIESILPCKGCIKPTCSTVPDI